MNNIPKIDFVDGSPVRHSQGLQQKLSRTACAQDTLTATDKTIVRLIETGDVSAVCALAHRAECGLAERVRKGEALLRDLGLISDGDGGSSPSARTGIVVLRSESARRVVIVFSGNSGLFSLPYPLAAHTGSHVIILRDPSRCFGFLGIPDIGGDYETCLANLQRIAKALGCTEIFCVGLSAGGSTAIRMGCDLQAQGVLGFSVPTTLDLFDEPGAQLRDYPQLTRLYNSARHFGIDLVKYYNRSFPRPQMLLLYGAGHRRDRWLAERARGIPGVELLEVGGYGGHATYRQLHDERSLDPLFDRLFLFERLERPAG
jgi:hypothetical protein